MTIHLYPIPEINKIITHKIDSRRNLDRTTTGNSGHRVNGILNCWCGILRTGWVCTKIQNIHML